MSQDGDRYTHLDGTMRVYNEEQNEAAKEEELERQWSHWIDYVLGRTEERDV